MKNAVKVQYGIESQTAPELNVSQWVNGEGKAINPVKLSDHAGKYRVIYCFQSWCPGCHKTGLPALKKMVDALGDSDKVEFFAIQTVFEGKEVNTYEKMLKVQKEYDLRIPFGHDEGDASTGNYSSVMYHYRNGGTPWFIFISPEGKVIFNDFRINAENAIQFFNDAIVK